MCVPFRGIAYNIHVSRKYTSEAVFICSFFEDDEVHPWGIATVVELGYTNEHSQAHVAQSQIYRVDLERPAEVPIQTWYIEASVHSVTMDEHVVPKHYGPSAVNSFDVRFLMRKVFRTCTSM